MCQNSKMLPVNTQYSKFLSWTRTKLSSIQKNLKTHEKYLDILHVKHMEKAYPQSSEK
jgi:hypothetical protein